MSNPREMPNRTGRGFQAAPRHVLVVFACLAACGAVEAPAGTDGGEVHDEPDAMEANGPDAMATTEVRLPIAGTPEFVAYRDGPDGSWRGLATDVAGDYRLNLRHTAYSIAVVCERAAITPDDATSVHLVHRTTAERLSRIDCRDVYDAETLYLELDDALEPREIGVGIRTDSSLGPGVIEVDAPSGVWDVIAGFRPPVGEAEQRQAAIIRDVDVTETSSSSPARITTDDAVDLERVSLDVAGLPEEYVLFSDFVTRGGSAVLWELGPGNDGEPLEGEVLPVSAQYDGDESRVRIRDTRAGGWRTLTFSNPTTASGVAGELPGPLETGQVARSTGPSGPFVAHWARDDSATRYHASVEEHTDDPADVAETRWNLSASARWLEAAGNSSMIELSFAPPTDLPGWDSAWQLDATNVSWAVGVSNRPLSQTAFPLRDVVSWSIGRKGVLAPE